MSAEASLIRRQFATYPVELTSVKCNRWSLDDERPVDNRDERISPVEVIRRDSNVCSAQ